jgi:neutrophil factor 2
MCVAYAIGLLPINSRQVDSFNAATELDKYLAVAYALIVWTSICRSAFTDAFPFNRYFQCGVSNFLLGRFDYALKDFEEALLYLRGNQNM